MQKPIDEGVTIFLYIICAIGILTSFFFMGLVALKQEYFKFQTPEFCIVRVHTEFF